MDDLIAIEGRLAEPGDPEELLDFALPIICKAQDAVALTDLSEIGLTEANAGAAGLWSNAIKMMVGAACARAEILRNPDPLDSDPSDLRQRLEDLQEDIDREQDVEDTLLGFGPLGAAMLQHNVSQSIAFDLDLPDGDTVLHFTSGVMALRATVE